PLRPRRLTFLPPPCRRPDRVPPRVRPALRTPGAARAPPRLPLDRPEGPLRRRGPAPAPAPRSAPGREQAGADRAPPPGGLGVPHVGPPTPGDGVLARQTALAGAGYLGGREGGGGLAG